MKYIVMMPKEGSTKIVNVLILGAGVLMLGCGHVCHYSECASSTLSIYSTLIATVWDYNAAILCHWWFLFLLWWCCWYANMSPYNLTWIQCKVSDTQGMLRHVDLYLEHNFTNFRKSLFVFSYFNIKIDEFDKKLMTYKSLQIMLDITPLLNSSVCLWLITFTAYDVFKVIMNKWCSYELWGCYKL